MGLMEPGCTRRDFGRDVQPAVPNRPRCWALVGSTFGAISETEAESTQHTSCLFQYLVLISLLAGPKFSRSGWRVGEQSQNTSRRKLCVLRKLHPQGGSVTRNVSGESLCGSAETIPGRYRVTMMGCSPGRPGWRAGRGMKRAPTAL